MSSPPKPYAGYRLGGLSSFLPLNEDAAVSTRGQRLPSLIQSRSSNALSTLGRYRSRLNSLQSTSTRDEEARPAQDERRRPAPGEIDARRMSVNLDILNTPQIRSMRLIGNSNPRYRWQKYYKSEDELKKMKKTIRQYYERNNFLIAQYLYIDQLLDSSLPHNLMAEYEQAGQSSVDIPNTISEEPHGPETMANSNENNHHADGEAKLDHKVKRTPKNLYKLPDVRTPLLEGEEEMPHIDYSANESDDSNSPVVTLAIYVNLAANFLLLIGKIAVIVLTSSLSVLASLVDAALDFLSTAIVWTTTKLISRQDQYAYPIGRRRLEPVGVLVFSVIMITSFFQVALECFSRLISDDRNIVELGFPAIAIMFSTSMRKALTKGPLVVLPTAVIANCTPVMIKGFCWFWCRLVKNSSVQALAQDAMTDCVFNTFSIIFPLVGFYADLWWADALGGLLLSLYVMYNWSLTTSTHVRNLCGAAATADERNVLLYLTMRFAKTIKHIQGLQAYHAGDKLNVEVDIVLAEDMSLRDSHDLGESLQYVLESVPMVDRAFVHTDYKAVNLPSHMNQAE